MIAIFSSVIDAQNFADKIHNWLSGHCPNYSAVCWQEPVVNKDKTAWYIQIPAEYYFLYYKDSDKIVAATKAEYDKKSAEKEKPDPALWDASTGK